MTQGVLKTHGICLMMYFKNNWNAGPFFYFMDIWMRSIIPTAHNSDSPLLRQPITPTAHFPDNAK